MAKDLLFNGHRYHPADDGPEGEAIKSRWAGVRGTVVTRLGDRPAILHQGQLYTQGERLVPGTDIDWRRVKGGRR